MSLFEDVDIFQTGPEKSTKFETPDAEITLHQAFFSKGEADLYYKRLLSETSWETYKLDIYGESRLIPRQIAWYEDAANFGAGEKRTGWTPDLLQIRQRVEQETAIAFNSVLLNLYRDGRDGVAWHSDREKNFGKNQIIASVTFGETRLFRLRHKTRKDLPVLDIPLRHGALLLMAGTTQSFWEHQVPKTARPVLPRINLTFRQVNREEYGRTKD